MIEPPPLVVYQTEKEYKGHYYKVYCKKPIVTFDSIPIIFRKNRFDHAFYESTKRDKRKDKFSKIRAERIDWIKATLQNPNAQLYCGWDNSKKKHDTHSRVNIVYGNFVVIIRIKKEALGNFRGEFVTAFLADDSIRKIKNNPRWNRNMIFRQKNSR
jgi:hypothetical protein